MTRSLNWYGWSIHTIAAVYETDAAAEESEQGLVSQEYVWAAWSAEDQQARLDRQQKEQDERDARPQP